SRGAGAARAASVPRGDRLRRRGSGAWAGGRGWRRWGASGPELAWPRRARSRTRHEVLRARNHVSVAAGEGQRAGIAHAGPEVEGHAGVDGPAVDVQGDDGLLPLHHDLVDGLGLVHGVDRPPGIALLDLAAVEVELGRSGQAVDPGHVLVVG